MPVGIGDVQRGAARAYRGKALPACSSPARSRVRFAAPTLPLNSRARMPTSGSGVSLLGSWGDKVPPIHPGRPARQPGAYREELSGAG